MSERASGEWAIERQREPLKLGDRRDRDCARAYPAALAEDGGDMHAQGTSLIFSLRVRCTAIHFLYMVLLI